MNAIACEEEEEYSSDDSYEIVQDEERMVVTTADEIATPKRNRGRPTKNKSPEMDAEDSAAPNVPMKFHGSLKSFQSYVNRMGNSIVDPTTEKMTEKIVPSPPPKSVTPEINDRRSTPVQNQPNSSGGMRAEDLMVCKKSDLILKISNANLLGI